MLLSAINSERMVSAQLLQLAFPAEAVVAFDVFPFSENAEARQWGWGRDSSVQTEQVCGSSLALISTALVSKKLRNCHSHLCLNQRESWQGCLVRLSLRHSWLRDRGAQKHPWVVIKVSRFALGKFLQISDFLSFYTLDKTTQAHTSAFAIFACGSLSGIKYYHLVHCSLWMAFS